MFRIKWPNAFASNENQWFPSAPLIPMFSALALTTVLFAGPQTPNKAQSSSNPDSHIFRRNLDLEMAVRHSAPFADAAEKQGLSVSSDDVRRRVQILNKIYPGQEIEPLKVERILLAEKYLESGSFKLQEQDLDFADQGKVDPNSFASLEEAGQARKAVRYQAVFGREEVRREARKLEDLVHLERRSKRNPAKMWSSRDLQLQGDPEECLAWDNQDCIVSLKEYNAAVLLYNLPSQIPLDSAKATIMRNYLFENRLADSALSVGLGRNADSLLLRERQAKQWSLWFQSAKAFGVPVKDDRSLQSAYGRYYHQYFAPRDMLSLAVIGSSDSSYIDSLHRVFTGWDNNQDSLKKRGKHAAEEPALPWTYFKADEMPEEISGVTDTIQVGRCSAPYRSRYGYFLVRLSKAVHKPEIPFWEAVPCLIYLATRDKYLSMDSIVEAEAKRYYKENLSRFALPDTMDVQTWLLPRQSGNASKNRVPTAVKPTLTDTADFKATLLSSISLPPDVRVALQGAIRKDTLKAFFGPFSDRFGLWYFKILSKKLAHDVLPYRLARREILERITAPMKEEEMGLASDEAQEKVMLNHALAKSYKQAASRKQAEKRKANGGGNGEEASNPNGLSQTGRTKVMELLRRRNEEEQSKNREKMDRILKDAKVDMARLSR